MTRDLYTAERMPGATFDEHELCYRVQGGTATPISRYEIELPDTLTACAISMHGRVTTEAVRMLERVAAATETIAPHVTLWGAPDWVRRADENSLYDREASVRHLVGQAHDRYSRVGGFSLYASHDVLVTMGTRSDSVFAVAMHEVMHQM